MKNNKIEIYEINEHQRKLFLNWLRDILVVEYKRDRETSVRLEDMIEFFDRLKEKKK